MARRFVIIGAGVAGVNAAEALRAHGFEGEILLFNDEPGLPYDRPPLSKAYAAGSLRDDDIILKPVDWYDAARIGRFDMTKVDRIDSTAHVVTVGGKDYPYDKLLLATGARARYPAGLDPDHPHVLVLRTAADAQRLRARLATCARIVLVGGGVIGMECAATAVKAGCAVTVLEGSDRVMARFLAPAIGDYVADRHRDESVEILTGFHVESIIPGDSGVAITGAIGRELQADLVLVGIGAVPEVSLAEAAGLELAAGGIAVDPYGRSSHMDIYAVGDCAAFAGFDGHHSRYENWNHAVRGAQIVARNMLGEAVRCDVLPWVWSDQYDMNIQVIGAPAGASMVLRGTFDSGKVTALHLDELGVLVGATTINQGRDKRVLEKLITGKARVDPAQLADPHVALKSFLEAPVN